MDHVGLTFGAAARMEIQLPNSSSRSPLSEGTIISGYRGHLPGLHWAPKGQTFLREIRHVVDDFRSRYRSSAREQVDSPYPSPLLPGPPFSAVLGDGNLLRALEQRGAPPREVSDAPSIPTPGYTGHIPRYRSSLGMGFTDATLRSLKEFREQRERWKEFKSRPVQLHV